MLFVFDSLKEPVHKIQSVCFWYI